MCFEIQLKLFDVESFEASKSGGENMLKVRSDLTLQHMQWIRKYNYEKHDFEGKMNLLKILESFGGVIWSEFVAFKDQLRFEN